MDKWWTNGFRDGQMDIRNRQTDVWVTITCDCGTPVVSGTT